LARCESSLAELKQRLATFALGLHPDEMRTDFVWFAQEFSADYGVATRKPP